MYENFDYQTLNKNSANKFCTPISKPIVLYKHETFLDIENVLDMFNGDFMEDKKGVTLTFLSFKHKECPLRALATIANETILPEYPNIGTSEKRIPMLFETKPIQSDALQRFLNSYIDTFKLISLKKSPTKFLFYALVDDIGLNRFRDIAIKNGIFIGLPFLTIKPNVEDYFFIIDDNHLNFINELEDNLSMYGEVQIYALEKIRDLDEVRSVLLRRIFELSREDERILSTAISLGYFDIPKRITLDELSEILGIPKSTLNVKLRGSLEKVLTRLHNMLKSYYELLGV